MPRNIDRYYVSCWAVSARLLQRLQWRRCGAAGAGACALASVYILRRCVGAAAHPEGKRGSMLADGAGLATPRGFFHFFSISTFKLTPCAHNPYGSPWGACARCPRTGRAHLAQGHELADVVVAPRQLGVFEVGQDLARPLRRLRPHALCVSVSRLRMGLYCMWACLACAL